jgi:DEAD/DEAH box helicase domain-containing protein
MMFKKIRFKTHENLGWGKIDLPEQEMHTSSCWIDFEEEFLYEFGGKETAGHLLHALAYLFNNIAPIFTFCDVHDIHTMQMARSNHSGKPAVFIYDSLAGGSGISHRVFEIIPLVAQAAAESVTKCVCENGCPGCIGPIQSDTSNLKEQVTKLLAIFFDGKEL